MERVRIWVMDDFAESADTLWPALELTYREGAGECPPIEVSTHPWSHAWTRLMRAFKTDSLPDIVQVGSTWLAPLIELAAIRPWPEEAAATLDPATGSGRTLAKAGWVHGYCWGAPWFIDFRVLYERVRRDGGGCPAPAAHDFESFVAVLSPERPWLIPAGAEPSLVHTLATWIWSHGVDVPPGSGVRQAWEYPVRRLYELGRRGALAPQGAWQNAPDANESFFRDGVGDWLLTRPRLLDDPETFAVRSFPRAAFGPNVFVGGSYLAVTARTGLHPEAFSVAQRLASRTAESHLSRAIVLWPAADGGVAPPIEAVDRLVEELAERGRSFPTVSHWQYIEDILGHGFSRILRQILAGAPWTEVLKELEGLEENLGLLQAVTML